MRTVLTLHVVSIFLAAIPLTGLAGSDPVDPVTKEAPCSSVRQLARPSPSEETDLVTWNLLNGYSLLAGDTYYAYPNPRRTLYPGDHSTQWISAGPAGMGCTTFRSIDPVDRSAGFSLTAPGDPDPSIDSSVDGGPYEITYDDFDQFACNLIVWSAWVHGGSIDPECRNRAQYDAESGGGASSPGNVIQVPVRGATVRVYFVTTQPSREALGPQGKYVWYSLNVVGALSPPGQYGEPLTDQMSCALAPQDAYRCADAFTVFLASHLPAEFGQSLVQSRRVMAALKPDLDGIGHKPPDASDIAPPTCDAAAELKTSSELKKLEGNDYALPASHLNLPASVHGELAVSFVPAGFSLCAQNTGAEVAGTPFLVPPLKLNLDSTLADGSKTEFTFDAAQLSWLANAHMPPGQHLKPDFVPPSLDLEFNPELNASFNCMRNGCTPELSIKVAKLTLQYPGLKVTLMHDKKAWLEALCAPKLEIEASLAGKSLAQMLEDYEAMDVEAQADITLVSEEISTNIAFGLEQDAAQFYGVDVSVAAHELEAGLEPQLAQVLSSDEAAMSSATLSDTEVVDDEVAAPEIEPSVDEAIESFETTLVESFEAEPLLMFFLL